MEVYDRKYMHLKNSSQILGNTNTGIGVGSVHNILFDEANLEAVKIELIGEDKEGNYKRKGVDYLAKIPAIKEEIKEFKQRWRSKQMQAINEGEEVPSEDEMPADLLEEKLILEARLDIYQEELAKIQERLDSLDNKEQDKDDQDVLKYGLICTGQLRDGVLVEIDGQNVEKVRGVMIIKDSRSPYNGMSVPDFRQLAKDWQEERKQADAKHLKTLQATARKEDKPVPNYYTSFSGGRKVPRNLLPKWNEGVTNHLEETEETEDSETE
jgi:hypothetical protein